MRSFFGVGRSRIQAHGNGYLKNKTRKALKKMEEPNG
jgi:hypothetical protein